MTDAMDADDTKNFSADSVSGFNVNAIAIELPISMLTSDGQVHVASDAKAVIGTYATTSRPRVRNLPAERGERDDLIEKELAMEDILYDKPRVILELICEKFGLEKSDIKKVTFYKWLARAKKEIVKNEARFKWKPGQNKEANVVGFKPTDPMESNGAGKIPTSTILKRPNYKK